MVRILPHQHCLPHRSHKVHEVGDVVFCEQTRGHGVVLLESGMQEGSRVARTAHASTRLVDRQRRHSELFALEAQRARGDQRYAEARRARGVDAVEHVDAQRHAHNEVHGVAHTHEVPRLACGQACGVVSYHAPELVLVLAAREPADGVARQIPFHHLIEAVLA